MTPVLHSVAIALCVVGLLYACPFVYRRSRRAGVMFTAALVIRAAAAAFFLAVSYYRLPLMTGLQMGGGFWTLASDAQEYYRLGSLVAGRWQQTITPGYVGPLGLWMRVVGVTPVAPLLLGLIAFAVTGMVLVAAFGRSPSPGAQRARDLAMAALCCSPLHVYASVFGLKDVLFTAVVVILADAYLTLLATAPTPAVRGTPLVAGTAVALMMWPIAGMRAYFAILLWMAVALTYVRCVIAGLPTRRRALAQGGVMLTVLALVIAVGAEGGYPRYVRTILISIPLALIEGRAPEAHGGIDELDRRRDAINRYGGNSMLSRPDEANDDGFASGGHRLDGLAVGLGALVLPTPLLGRLAHVDLGIGRAARLIADADTLVFDLTILMILWTLIAHRREVSPLPLVFCLALAALIALPLAYVMTNFGTLIRLRLMVAAPIWLMTLSLAPRFAPSSGATGAEPTVTSV